MKILKFSLKKNQAKKIQPRVFLVNSVFAVVCTHKHWHLIGIVKNPANQQKEEKKRQTKQKKLCTTNICVRDLSASRESFLRQMIMSASNISVIKIYSRRFYDEFITQKIKRR